jgi:hypothetical protein
MHLRMLEEALVTPLADFLHLPLTWLYTFFLGQHMGIPPQTSTKEKLHLRMLEEALVTPLVDVLPP